MPRKPLIYTDEFPYHIVARANNQEWFKVELDKVWTIFVEELNDLNLQYDFQIHCFTLMSNHYHLLASCSEHYDLGYVMRILQTKTSHRINSESGRTNHVYGARYRASLITTEIYYATVLKYVLRNPITAQICEKISEWKYQTIEALFDEALGELPLSSPLSTGGLVSAMTKAEAWNWLHEDYEPDVYQKIRGSLKRGQFKLRGWKRPLTRPL